MGGRLIGRRRRIVGGRRSRGRRWLRVLGGFGEGQRGGASRSRTSRLGIGRLCLFLRDVRLVHSFYRIYVAHRQIRNSLQHPQPFGDLQCGQGER